MKRKVLALVMLVTCAFFVIFGCKSTQKTEETQVVQVSKENEVETELLSSSAEWAYWYGTTANPKAAENWFAEDFDDSSWNRVNGPLGYGVSSKVSYEYSSITTDNKPPYNTIGEEGKVPATYYRTTFNIDDMNMVKKVSGLIDYDDAAYIYVNGVLRVKAGGFKADYKNRDFDPEIAATVTGGDATGAVKAGNPVIEESFNLKASWLKEGKNTIAVVMFQDTGSSSDSILKLSLKASNYIELAKPDRINVTFYGDTKTQKAITWYSDGNGGAGTLQYIALNPSKVNIDEINWNKAKTVTSTQSGDLEYIKRLILTALKPNTTYFYRVGNDNLWSDVGYFTTAQKNNGDGVFSFIAVTDQQGSDESDFAHWSANINSIIDTYGNEISFVVDAGDFVNNGLNEAEWKMCLNTAAMRKTTLVPVTGNHEGYDYAGSFENHFTVENQPNAITSKGSYYSFDYENVHFVVLNTDEKENEDLSKAQLAWFEDDLVKATNSDSTKWIIVVLHRSLYSSGDHSTDGDVINLRSSVGSLLAKYNVDAVISGHDHVYLRTKSLYNGVAQPYNTEVIDGVTYAVNPKGTVHICPATISNKNYELATTADYRILQAAEVEGETYENGRQKYVSYSLLTGSKFYPEGMSENAAVFVKVDVNKDKLVFNSYGIVDGKIEAEPFDSYAILKDSKKESLPVVTENEEISKWIAEGNSGGGIEKKTYNYTGEEYDAEKDFNENTGKQGPIWYYFYEENYMLKELIPLKGTVEKDGTTGDLMKTDCLWTQHPGATNIGNDNIQNGSVRLYDGAHDGNPRPEGERMTLVPYSDDNSEAGKDDIVVAWRAPKSGWVEVTDWNPEFIGIIPAEKYLNTYAGFWVDIRFKDGATGNPTSAANYREDSTSILATQTFPEGDGIVSGGAPKLIDKGGPYDGGYTTGAYVQVGDLVKVDEGDYIYFVSHCGNNYGWRGVLLDVVIKYVEK